MKIVNLFDAEPGDEWDRDGFRFRGRRLGEVLDSERLGCGLYDLPTGEQLWPYHWHTEREEWLLVLVGAPTLRTPEGERELRAGDVVAFPAGEAGAHTLYNRAEAPARVAMFSTLGPTEAVYPDSGKVSAPGGLMFRVADAVDYWDGEGPAR